LFFNYNASFVDHYVSTALCHSALPLKAKQNDNRTVKAKQLFFAPLFLKAHPQGSLP